MFFGLSGGVGAAGLGRGGNGGISPRGICGRERPEPPDDVMKVLLEDFLGEGLVCREGSCGLGLPGTLSTGLAGDGDNSSLLGEISPVLNGLLETSRPGMSGWLPPPAGDFVGELGLVGESRGGSRGGRSVGLPAGEADLTVLTEAVEEMESELEVTLSFEGEMGDLPVPRSSVLELSLPLVSRRPAGT